MKNCWQKSCVKSCFKGSGLKRREDELEGDLNFFGIYKHEKRHGLWKRHIFKIGVDPRTQGKNLKQLSLIGIPLTLENMKIFMILLKGFIVFFISINMQQFYTNFVPCKNFQIFSPTTHIFGKTKNDIFLSHEYCLPYYEIFHIFN